MYGSENVSEANPCYNIMPISIRSLHASFSYSTGKLKIDTYGVQQYSQQFSGGNGYSSTHDRQQ